MSNQLDLKQEIKQEKKKFKTLSFGEKIRYIKDYYRLHILTVIIIAVVVYAVYITYEAKNFNTVLYAVLINNDKSVWDEDTDSYEAALSVPFEQHLGLDGQNDRIIIDNSYILNQEKDFEMSVYSAESLVAMIYAGHIDLHIGDEYSFDYFTNNNELFFYDLRELFDEAFLEKHKDSIIYQTMSNGTSFPVAFDVSDCEFIKDAGLTTSPTIISVYANSTRLETAVEYIRFVLEKY